MNNKINVRFKSLSTEKIKRLIVHNFRLRKDLKNVNYEKSKNNLQSLDLKETRAEINHHLAEHKKLYKKTFKERLRPERINSLREIVITFPKGFQKKIDSGEIQPLEIQKCVQLFIDKYEEQTGLKVLGYSGHFDELTDHWHLLTTQYLSNGRTYRAKGYGSYLQDLGGWAFSSVGLERGTPKKFTHAEHQGSRDHYEQLLKQSHNLDQLFEQNLITAENIGTLIAEAVVPLKTLLTYVKRSLNTEKEAAYIIKQQDRALQKFHGLFPTLSSIKDFDQMLNYIAANKSSFKIIEPDRED